MHDISFEDRFLLFVDETIGWFQSRAKRSQWAYNLSRACLVVLSAALPAIIAATGDTATWKTLLIAVSVVIAILAGLDAQFRPGEQWRHHRSTQLTLMRLKRNYEYSRLHDQAKSFGDFFDGVETLLAAEANQFWTFRIMEWSKLATAKSEAKP